MKRSGIKTVVFTLAFTVTLFAGANQTFAKTNESNKPVKEINVSVPKESKLKGTDNAKVHGGNAYSYGKAEDKLTGIENAKEHGGNAYAKEEVEEDEVEVEVKLAKVKTDTPLLTGIENAQAHGGKANAYGKAPDKLTGIENAKSHGGNAFAKAKADVETDEDDVVVEEPTCDINEELSMVIETPELKGIENAKAHGGKAHAYGHSKKIKAIDLIQ